MSTNATFNFSAGPAMLPKEVMDKAQREFIDWQGKGVSVMEVSHRGADFMDMAQQAEQDLRDLMSVPSNYRVLFMAGGASLQFSAVPLNLLKTKATYLNTGIWGKKAIAEAQRFGNIDAIDALEKTAEGVAIKKASRCNIGVDEIDYLHFTPNETIGGIEYLQTPDVGKGKWVADMSSNILSRAINVNDYALIYAGAQKNIGPAGLGIVIVRDDLIEKQSPHIIPSLLDYKKLAETDSMYNTPPTFGWYLAGLVFKWIKQQGGVDAMSRRAEERSGTLYQFIDQSDLFSNPVAKSCRSRMTIPFILNDEALDKKFLHDSEQQGLLFLKGHRSVGGMRASMYNAMPVDGAKALVEFMKEFERTA